MLHHTEPGSTRHPPFHSCQSVDKPATILRHWQGDAGSEEGLATTFVRITGLLRAYMVQCESAAKWKGCNPPGLLGYFISLSHWDLVGVLFLTPKLHCFGRMSGLQHRIPPQLLVPNLFRYGGQGTKYEGTSKNSSRTERSLCPPSPQIEICIYDRSSKGS